LRDPSEDRAKIIKLLQDTANDLGELPESFFVDPVHHELVLGGGGEAIVYSGKLDSKPVALRVPTLPALNLNRRLIPDPEALTIQKVCLTLNVSDLSIWTRIIPLEIQAGNHTATPIAAQESHRVSWRVHGSFIESGVSSDAAIGSRTLSSYI
jgi:hypothetical protein